MNNETVVLAAAIKLTRKYMLVDLYAVSVTFDSSSKQYTYLSDVHAEAGSKAEVVVNDETKIVTVKACEPASNAADKLRTAGDKLKMLKSVYRRTECNPAMVEVLAGYVDYVTNKQAELLLRELGLSL